MSLATKYRPRTFSNVAGQTLVKKILTSSVLKSPAGLYLFSGMWGTSKTSCARIFAKSLNCHSRVGVDPCNKCPSCLSVEKDCSSFYLEVDSASCGVDDVRRIIQDVKTNVVGGERRVIVFDEAHSLTHAASDALLKVLEEGGVGTVFILTTTNPDKIYDTIRSRSIVVTFSLVDVDDIKKYILGIMEKELSPLPEDFETIARDISYYSSGHVRDAVMLLEKLILIGLTRENLRELLGRSRDSRFFELILLLPRLTSQEVLDFVETNFRAEFVSDLYGKLKEAAFKVLEVSYKRADLLPEEFEKAERILELYSEAYHPACDFILHLQKSDDFLTFIIDILSLKRAMEGKNPYLSDKMVRILPVSEKRTFVKEIDRLKFYGTKKNRSAEGELSYDAIIDRLRSP